MAYGLGTLSSGQTQPVVVRPLPSGAAEPVDVQEDGTPNGCPIVSEIWITPNGRFVVFTAYDLRIVSGDRNGQTDVLVVDRAIPFKTPLKSPSSC